MPQCPCLSAAVIDLHISFMRFPPKRLGQDTERGRHASLSTLLEEVRDRVGARVPREELDRARAEARSCAASAVLALDASLWLKRLLVCGRQLHRGVWRVWRMSLR